MKILFINACVRENSRTLLLAKHLLNRLSGDVSEVNLEKENIQPLNAESLNYRESCLHTGKTDDKIFRFAHQFADADTIVIAAPFWDLSFPSSLKNYIEAITVSGITFTYVNNIPKGLCNAKKLYFVSTCGGPFSEDFGCNYIKALAQGFYGIPDFTCFKAEFLDVVGADVDGILAAAKNNIDSVF